MGYYDIEDILAESEKFPCKFNYEIPGLGYLESRSGKSISKNTKLELPYWLTKVLATVFGEQEHVDEEPQPFIQLLGPEIFSSKVLNAIKFDECALDVHAISSHFYALGIKWAALFSDMELMEVLNKMILGRAQEINNHASSVSLDPEVLSSNAKAHFHSMLDEFEKVLYRDAHNSYKRSKQWLAGK